MERMESSPMLCKQGVTGSIPVTSTYLFNDLCAHSVFSSSALQSKLWAVKPSRFDRPAEPRWKSGRLASNNEGKHSKCFVESRLQVLLPKSRPQLYRGCTEFDLFSHESYLFGRRRAPALGGLPHQKSIGLVDCAKKREKLRMKWVA
jgi:hypothetical protein